MPVSTSHYQSYDNTFNGLSSVNGLPSNGVVIVSPNNQSTSLQSAGINNNNNCSNGVNSVNNNNNKDKHYQHHQNHHKHQQSTSILTVRPTSPPIDQPHLNGTFSQLTSPNSSSSRPQPPPIMNGNGGLINGGGNGTMNRNSSKNRITVNHISSPSIVGAGGGSGGGGGGLLSTTTSPTGNTFNSTKQTLLDITRTGIGGGLTPPGLVTSSSSATVTAAQGSRIPLRNGGLNISRISGPPLSPARLNQTSASDIIFNSNGISEMLSSLALMCLLSLLMAFLALFFLQRTGPIITIPEDLKPNELPLSPSTGSPPTKDKSTVNVFSQSRIVVNTREYVRVFQISVSLSTLTISLNLCCLFVCCIQFLSAVKLLKAPQGTKRTLQFLKKTSHVRITAIGAFLLSIPIFFTGVILFTFINFDETPALITSVIIGIGIVFCGLASVQNVYLWQAEKTRASKELSETRLTQYRESALLQPIELSTLV